MSLLGKIRDLVPGPLRSTFSSAKAAIQAVEGQVRGKNLADTFDNVQYLASQTAKNGFAEIKDRLGIALHGTPKGPFPSMVDLQKKFPQAGLPPKMIGTNLDDAVTYDPKVDPDQVMAKIEATGMNSVRMGAYWDQIQPAGADQADFARLDAWLAAAERHHVKVVLTVGAKAPNWPEYHVPKWATPSAGKDVSTDPVFSKNVEAFVRLVAEHEKSNGAICMWQVENEPFERVGPDHHEIGTKLIASEAAILREVDGGRRPLMINCFAGGDRRPVEEAFKQADLVGLDVYGPVPIKAGTYERTVGAPANALALSKQSGKPLLVAELQADDWGNYKSTANDITELSHSLEKMGYSNLLFWRFDTNLSREKQGDKSLTDAEAQLAHEALFNKP